MCFYSMEIDYCIVLCLLLQCPDGASAEFQDGGGQHRGAAGRPGDTHTTHPSTICHIRNIVIDTQQVLQLQIHYHITPQTSTPHSSHYHSSLLTLANLTPHTSTPHSSHQHTSLLTVAHLTPHTSTPHSSHQQTSLLTLAHKMHTLHMYICVLGYSLHVRQPRFDRIAV